jgi:hypothetical protein
MSNEYTTTKSHTRIYREIVRHNDNFFYSEREGNNYLVDGRPISAVDAQSIITANKESTVWRTGKTRFDPGEFEFSWTARVEVTVSGSNGDGRVIVYRHLRHPELAEVPAVAAEWNGYWRDEAGQIIGLILRYPGEHRDRCLSCVEVAQLEGGRRNDSGRQNGLER